MSKSTHKRVLFAWRLLTILLTMGAEWFFHTSVMMGMIDQFWYANFPFFVQVVLIVTSLALTRIFRHDISLRQFNRAKQKDHMASSYLKSVCVSLGNVFSCILIVIFSTALPTDGEGLAWYRSVMGACSTFYTLLFLETMIIRNDGVYSLGTAYRLLAATVNLIGLDVVHTHAALQLELLYLLYIASDAIAYYSLFLKTTSIHDYPSGPWLRASFLWAVLFLIGRLTCEIGLLINNWNSIEHLEKIYFFVCEGALWLPVQCWNIYIYRRACKRFSDTPTPQEAEPLAGERERCLQNTA